MVNSRISLSKNEIMFGIIHQDSTFCLALNHLVTIGKYFLYVNALNSKKIMSCIKIKVEKYISCTSGRKKELRQNCLLSILCLKLLIFPSIA